MVDTNVKKGFWNISVGNVVSWLLVVISYIWFARGIVDKVDQNKQEVVSVKEDVAGVHKAIDDWAKVGLVSTVTEHERRIVALEHQSSDIAEIKVDVQWIKKSLDEMKKNK